MKKHLALWVLLPVLMALVFSASAQSNAPLPFITRGAVWKYWSQLENPPATWKEANCDDTQWAAGPAQLGYGDGDEATPMYTEVPAAQRPVTAYFRIQFQVTEAAAVANLAMNILRDDGAVVYLNGVEVYRNNMPEGPVDGQTLALTSINHAAEKLYVAGALPTAPLISGVNVLAVEIHQVVPGSADLSFDLDLTGNASAGETQALIAKGSQWKYLDDGSDQGTAWVAPGFDDSAWKAGAGPLGYNNDNEATVVSYGPDAANKYITTYFRKKFTVADPAAISNLIVRVMRDDGAATYLNGVQITRGNLSAAATYLTRARSNYGPPAETNYYSARVNPALLVAGENVLAAEVHQYSASSADLSFDLELISSNGTPNLPPTIALASPTAQDSFTAPADIALAAEVHKGSSEILWVEFFANGQVVGRATTAPYAITWSQVPFGVYTIRATATDAQRNQANSKTVTISVAPATNQPPTIALTQPLGGTSFVTPANILLKATAADADGTVLSVQFFAGDALIGQGVIMEGTPASQAPTYQCTWANAPVGEYQITAQAIDNQGVHARSAPVAIHVINSTTTPVVSVSSTNRVAIEGGPLNAEFQISRSGGDLSRALTVCYVMGGKAVNGVDYLALPGVVTIPAGEVFTTVTVQALTDSANESGESVILTLVPNPTENYLLGATNSYSVFVVEAPPPLPGTSLAPASAAPAFTPFVFAVQRLPDGICHLSVVAEPGKAVIIEASTDLDDWTVLATVPNPDGVLEFTDPSAVNFRQTYYRVVVE